MANQTLEKSDETHISEKRDELIKLHTCYVKMSDDASQKKAFEELYMECIIQIRMAETTEDLEFIQNYYPEGTGIKYIIEDRKKEMSDFVRKTNPKRINKSDSIKSIIRVYTKYDEKVGLRKASIPKLEKLCENDGIFSADFSDLCHLFWDFDDSCSFRAVAKKMLTEHCTIDIENADIKELAKVFKVYPGDNENYRLQILKKATAIYLSKIENEKLIYKKAEHLKSFSDQFITSVDAKWEDDNIGTVDELCLLGCKKVKTVEQLDFYIRLVENYVSNEMVITMRTRGDSLDDTTAIVSKLK